MTLTAIAGFQDRQESGDIQGFRGAAESERGQIVAKDLGPQLSPRITQAGEVRTTEPGHRST